ncbi:MAG: hypothetical protein H7Y00_09300 [Fimbriimonadaceae bacterium]|nr:hypothetical protein [Chitinophagales bacterium]
MQSRKIKHNFAGFIKAGLQAGFLVGVVNIIWFLFSTKLLFIDAPENINMLSVSITCIVVALLVAVGFYFLFPRVKKPVLVFRGIVFILALISLFGATAGTMPDGSAAPERFHVLAIPMHIFAGIFIGYFIPKFLKKDVSAMFRQTS